MKSIIAFLTAFFIFELDQTKGQTRDISFVEIKARGCGNEECPVFMFRIVSDGRASLSISENKFLPLRGLYKANGLKDEFRQVVELIEKINFFEIVAKKAQSHQPLFIYPPMSRITVEEQRKKIFLRYSYSSDFENFDERVFEIVKSINWEKIN